MAPNSRGLSAAELATETIFPGDTIEYFSMAFVAGDPRGHRLAKVLRVARHDIDFPIRIDSQEMIPLTLMIKRKRDRLDHEIPSADAKWRKLRTFRLVDGEVEGPTRADRLNNGLKAVLGDAIAATKKRLADEKADRALSKSKMMMQNFFKPRTQSDSDFEPQVVKKRNAATPTSPVAADARRHRIPLAMTQHSDLNRRQPSSSGDRSPEKRREGKKRSRHPSSPNRDEKVGDDLSRQRHRHHSGKKRSHRSPSPDHEKHRTDRKTLKREQSDFMSVSTKMGGDEAKRSTHRDSSSMTSRESHGRRASSHSSKKSHKKHKKHKKAVSCSSFISHIEEKTNDPGAPSKRLEKEDQSKQGSDLKSGSESFKRRLQLNQSSGTPDATQKQKDYKKVRHGEEKKVSKITDWFSARGSKNAESHNRGGDSEKAATPKKKERTLDLNRPNDSERHGPDALGQMFEEVFSPEKKLPIASKESSPKQSGRQEQDQKATPVGRLKDSRKSGSPRSLAHMSRRESSDGKKLAPKPSSWDRLFYMSRFNLKN